VQGICPADWHLPTDGEWTTITNFLGGPSVAGGKMKETGTTHWNPPNTAATNESGFTALPGGLYYDGSFLYMSSGGYWWSSTETPYSRAWTHYIGYNYSYVYRYNNYKTYGLSVRCVRDNLIIHTNGRNLFDNFSIRAKDQANNLSGSNNKNNEPVHFIFKGGNPAEAVYTFFIKGMEIGDEIGIYDEAKLVGSGVINSDNIFENSVPVFGNLYKVGNIPIIKVWDKSENIQYVLNNYTFSNPYGDAWTENVFPAEDGEYSLLHFSTTVISDENKIDQYISIYPNPSDGIFNISIEGVNGKVQIKVFDVHGNNYRIFEIEGTRNIITEKLDLKELPAGVYFISFSGKDFNQVKKIVIQ